MSFKGAVPDLDMGVNSVSLPRSCRISPPIESMAFFWNYSKACVNSHTAPGRDWTCGHYFRFPKGFIAFMLLNTHPHSDLKDSLETEDQCWWTNNWLIMASNGLGFGFLYATLGPFTTPIPGIIVQALPSLFFSLCSQVIQTKCSIHIWKGPLFKAENAGFLGMWGLDCMEASRTCTEPCLQHWPNRTFMSLKSETFQDSCLDKSREWSKNWQSEICLVKVLVIHLSREIIFQMLKRHIAEGKYVSSKTEWDRLAEEIRCEFAEWCDFWKRL